MSIAYVSNLPIADLETTRKHYKFIAALQNKKVRIRFRGPRRDVMRRYTLKKDAVRFSVYFD